MTEFFLSLEQDFIKYLNTINRHLVEINSKPDAAENLISDTQLELREAEKCIKQMEIEVMNLPEQSRRENNQRIRRHRADYEDVKKTFTRTQDTVFDQRDKNRLMGGSRFEDEEIKTNGKYNSLLEVQNRKLENAKKTGYTTLEIASSTNKELYRHTEVLERNKSRLKQMDSDLGESNSLINSIQRKIWHNKLVFYGVVGMVGLAIVLIVLSYF